MIMNRLKINHIARRFNSHGSHGTKSTSSTFTNKFNFNINPPPVHEFWNIYNTSIVVAFIPVFFTVSYLTKVASDNNDGFGGLLEFSHSEAAPKVKFGEPQLPTKN